MPRRGCGKEETRDLSMRVKSRVSVVLLLLYAWRIREMLVAGGDIVLLLLGRRR